MDETRCEVHEGTLSAIEAALFGDVLPRTQEEILARIETLYYALQEIESFPVSGYHAAEAQRMARAVLADSNWCKRP